jgi:hypothetical protein
MEILNIVVLSFIVLALPACVYVPVSNNDAESSTCKTYTHSMSLDVIGPASHGNSLDLPKYSGPSVSPSDCRNSDCAAAYVALAVAATVAAGSAIISGSIVVSDNTVHWLEYQGRCNDGYLNKAKQVLFDSINAPPASGNPNIDLQHGVATLDFALITQSLDKGADINFHDQSSLGVFCNIASGRAKAVNENRSEEYDKETDKLVELLISRGASPTLTSTSGRTFVDCSEHLPTSTLHKLLMLGWPNDYSYWLYAGVVSENSDIINEAIEHGADPNKPIRNLRYLDYAMMSPRELSEKGQEAAQKKGLEAMEILLKSGAKVDDGKPNQAGDIIKTYIYFGDRKNIQPVFELLIKYASPEAKKNSLDWIMHAKSIMSANHVIIDQDRQANIEWLVKRLSQQSSS